MSVNAGPPRWAERLLERMVADRGGDAIVGDLREEYLESKLSQRGRVRANWWYLRQVASFVAWPPQRVGRGMRSLAVVSVFTSVCMCWLAAMEFVLRHPGYAARACAWLAIAVLCVLPILIQPLRLSTRAERWLWPGGVALIAFGLSAFVQNARAAHFEGYAVVISVALVIQGLLMLAVLGRPHATQRRMR